jgi:hypothetical protein
LFFFLFEELESKDLLLKEIELMFENGYFYTYIEKMIQKFYKDNKMKINFFYSQVLDKRFKRDPTLEVQKDIDVYRFRQEQIAIIEKRRQLWKTTRKNEKKTLTELIMILTFRATSVTNLRKSLNLLLIMRSR